MTMKRLTAKKINDIWIISTMFYLLLKSCCVLFFEGSAEAYYEYGLHCWDMAAASLIVLEAGGVVIDPNGNDLDIMSRRVLCASSSEIAKTISGRLTHLTLERD